MPSDIGYVYDQLGRLTAVIDQAGDAARLDSQRYAVERVHSIERTFDVLDLQSSHSSAHRSRFTATRP